jgi:hypothetical protein
MRGSISAGLLLSLAPIATFGWQYGYNHDKVQKDGELVAKSFPNVKNIELNSPYFLDPDSRLPGFVNGTSGPSSIDTVGMYYKQFYMSRSKLVDINYTENFLQDVADRNDYMTFGLANFTSEELRPFPYVHLSARRCTGRRHGNGTKTDKIRIWIQGAAHGNEPAGDEATMALLGKFDAEPEWAESVLDKVELIILPRYNPDGVYYFQRRLSTNYDPNRDHIKVGQQQTRDIKKMFSRYAPHVVVDMHEYTATRVWGDQDQFYHASDGMFSAAKNLNINERIRTLSEELFAKNVGDDMEAAGLRWEPYTTGTRTFGSNYVAEFAEAGTDGRIGRNAMGLTQSVTFLVEMRGIQLADQQFQRRIAAGLTMLSSIVQTAVDNAEEVLTTIEGGINDFVTSNDDVVITDYRETAIRPYYMVDSRNGSVVRPPVRFTSSTPAFANLTRARPEAYIIPVGWADLATRLRDSGVEVEQLETPFVGTVEALTVTSAELDSSYTEGTVRLTVTTEAAQREISLPKGSFRVSTRQRNAALAMVALEPENIDSYVSDNVVPLEKGWEYPIFRAMS